MKPCYIIEQTTLGYYYNQLSKINYYDGHNSLYPYTDNINDADIFHTKEEAENTIKALKRNHFIRDAWRYEYKILNYCPV